MTPLESPPSGQQIPDFQFAPSDRERLRHNYQIGQEFADLAADIEGIVTRHLRSRLALLEQEREQGDTLIASLRKQLREVDRPHREWAIENTRKYESVVCPVHGESLDGFTGNAAPCPWCYREMGRREGQMQAGAYWTHEEAFARLRAAAPTEGGDAEGISHAEALARLESENAELRKDREQMALALHGIGMMPLYGRDSGGVIAEMKEFAIEAMSRAARLGPQGDTAP